MKRQEICQKTGLTPKALRLYEEKGLITPEATGLHNRTREYSQADLDRLVVIATLRRAMFTIQEIKEMLEDPESIQSIFPQYVDWLRQQSAQLDRLLAVSEQVDLRSVDSAAELTAQIESAAKELPIPASDIHFRFRQLDALEEHRTDFTTEEQMDRLLPVDKTYRSSVVAISRDKLDNTLAFNSQLNDTISMLEDGSRSVGERQVRLRFWEHLIRWGLDLTVLILILCAWQDGALFPVGYVLLPAALLRAGLAWRDRRSAQRSWIQTMGWTADYAQDRKRKLKIAAALISCLVIIIGGSTALISLLRPVEPVDGPSTAGLDMREFFAAMPPGLFHMYSMGDLGYSYAVGPNRVYFILEQTGTLYSIDADYGNLIRIDDYAVDTPGALSAVEAPREQPCNLIYDGGCLYYVSWRRRGLAGNRRGPFLMCYESGTKVNPQVLATGVFSAIGLSEDGEIICYRRENSGTWIEVTRTEPVKK